MSNRLTVCKAGLHAMIPANVWTRPNDSARYCRACLKASRKRLRPGKGVQEVKPDTRAYEFAGVPD